MKFKTQSDWAKKNTLQIASAVSFPRGICITIGLYRQPQCKGFLNQEFFPTELTEMVE